MEYPARGDREHSSKEKLQTSRKVPHNGWNRTNPICVSHRKPSVIQPKISRLSSFFELLSLGRYHWRLLIAVLSLFHMTEAYISVLTMTAADQVVETSTSMYNLTTRYCNQIISMNGMCKINGPKSLRLSPEAAISLLLDSSGNIRSTCKLELIAPETHSISLLFTRRKPFGEIKTDASKNERGRVPKCPLVVSFPLLRPEEVKMVLDLCSEDAFKSVEHFTDLLPSRVTLEWIPNVKNSNEILASEVVVAAVGRGREICSRPTQFPCRSMGYPIYCIDKNLMCDGKRNCPFEGRDEDKELCSSEGNLDKVGFGVRENPRIGGGWEFLASEFLKKLSSRENTQLRKFEMPSSTEQSTVLWSDDGTIHSRDSESLPDVLKHYGPWGYLMLGMLICGTVLMFCGLWECCCRRPKALVSNAVGPALLIINQGAQQSELEIPSTPGPPRYEELDQPPSYSALFPSSKPPESHSVPSPTNALPITIPMVHSLSIMRNNSSQINSSSNSPSDRNCAVPASDACTKDLQNTNSLDISRDIRDNGPSPK